MGSQKDSALFPLLAQSKAQKRKEVCNQLQLKFSENTIFRNCSALSASVKKF
jgi:hypothetical protein